MRRACTSVKPVRLWQCGSTERSSPGEHVSDTHALVGSIPTAWTSSMGVVIVAAHLACNQEAGVRFSAPPPNPPGRPLRSRRWPETPDKHVRLVPLAPTVAVAQWQSGGLWPRPREFDSLRSPHFVRLAAGRGQTIAAE